MSYFKKIEYEIVPGESFSVIRNCSGCGRKSRFVNTKKFRINANGSRLDVWLIYQCENCRHTLNLTIYERVKASSIPEKEYKGFLNNEEELAEVYGKDIRFFRKNKAEIDFERLSYDYILLQSSEDGVDAAGEGASHSAEFVGHTAEEADGRELVYFTIKNPWELKIRPEKQIAEAFKLSRSQVKKFMMQGRIRVEDVSAEMICGYKTSSM